MPDPLHLPGFRVERLAGVGGSGDVWVAREVATGDRVALKRLRGAAAEPGAGAALAREAALLASVRHPHVLRTRGLVQTPTGPVLVLDLAEGGSLARLLRARGRLTPGEVVTVTAPVAQALAAVHRHGLLHGDVSPGNVLLTLDGRPLLADLGGARTAGLRPRTAGVTADHAAPEVLDGQAPRPASDVHGLASVALHALTGVPPVRWGPADALALDGLPSAALAALDRAVAPDPAVRPDAEELATALFALAEPQPLHLEPVPPVGAAGDGSDGTELTHEVRVVPPSPPAARARLDPAVAPAGGGSWRERLLRRSRVSGEPIPVRDREVDRVDDERGVPLTWLVVSAVVVAVVVWGAVSVAPRVLAGVASAPVAAPAPAATPASASTSTPPSPRPTPTPTRTPTLSPTPTPAPSVRSSAPPAAPRAAPSTPLRDGDWAAVVTGLHATRARALAQGETALLRRVYAPGAAGLARDTALLRAYAAAGVRPRGLDFEVARAALLTRTPTRVTLEVTDRLGAYEVVDAAGRVAGRRPGLPQATWRAALVQADGQWRLA